MEGTEESFHFSGNLSNLLVQGLTIASTKDLILFLSGLVVAAFLTESLQRISRECFRKVPRPSQRDTQLKGCRSSGKVLLKQTPQEEESPWLEMGERARHTLEDINVNQETSCGPGECGGLLENGGTGQETASLVDKETCCQDTPELTEEQNMVRVEKMWKSLSLDVLNDRLELYQTTCREPNDGHRITRSYRVAFHILQTFILMGKITVGYVFMLLVMTYNVWFLLCVVGGAGLGYLLFSSDLEKLYADYAERYIRLKAVKRRIHPPRSIAVRRQ